MPRFWQILPVVLVIFIIPFSAHADLDLPVVGTVTSGVGWRADPFGSGKLVFHKGIDIAVSVGTPVRATRGGRVLFAGDHGGHGATVIVEHENGDKTLYGHNSVLTVQQGARVVSGAVIALSGNSGKSTGPHVHYEEMRGSRPVIMAAEVRETQEPPPALAREFRNQQEQRMNEIVNSILRNISNSPVIATPLGQGG